VLNATVNASAEKASDRKSPKKTNVVVLRMIAPGET
jgi:hypothetical protein